MSNLPLLIGITGKAGAGKDTVAAMLTERHGYTRRSLADPIKELLNKRFGWTADMWNDREWKEEKLMLHGARLMHPGIAAYDYFSPRSWAQWLGTEVGRETFGPDVWIEKLLVDWYADKRPMVVPDVRFDNEAKAIIKAGGLILRVDRPGLPPVTAHASEAGVSEHLVHLTVINDRTVEHLADRAEQVLLRAVGAG